MNKLLPKRLAIFYSIWSKPTLWIVAKGVARSIKCLEEGRAIAREKGYSGIRVVSK